MTADLKTRMVAFVEALTSAMGLSVTVQCESIEDGTRITIDGESGERLLRRKAAGLDALQHIVNAAFRSEHTEGHIAVDCLDYRKGKDDELRQTALLLAERARTTGETQEVRPLNPYARRIVHLAVSTGTPTVAILGPTAAARNGPYPAEDEVVKRNLPCSNSYRRVCNEFICMDIPPETVFSAVGRRLGLAVST